MKFLIKDGIQFPTCYTTPQDFLDSIANSMTFQDVTTTPLFYNGDLKQETPTGIGPPKIIDTTTNTEVYYSDAVWYDPRKGGTLYTDSSFTSSLRELMPEKGYRKFFGRNVGDIVPFVWKSSGPYFPSNPSSGEPVQETGKYYFPDDVACAYNNWQRIVPYTVTSDIGSTTYNVVMRPWVYCDGYNYATHPIEFQRSARIGRVPNLVSRMIMGKGGASNLGGTIADERLTENLKGGLGVFGGTMAVKLWQNMLPNHRHQFIDKSSATNVATSSAGTSTGYAVTEPIAANAYATRTDEAESSNVKWHNANNNRPHQNMPPFFVCGFKMYVGYGY